MTELPYAGTSGHSGSSTSRERAEREDANGTTSERQRKTLISLGARHSQGLTWRELALQHGWHHGQASGVLSNLHKSGKIVRLAETRNRCKVYVLPEYALTREREPHGGKKKNLISEEEAATIRELWVDTSVGPGELTLVVREDLVKALNIIHRITS